MRTLFAFFFLSACSSWATIGVVDDIRTMTQKSGLIVEAKVIAQQVSVDDRGRIITFSKLKVKDGLKGAETGQELTLYQVGGEYQGRVMRLQGASIYRPGEKLVLFAVPYRDKMIVSYGLGLGKFNIVEKKNGDRVVEDIHGLQVLQMKAGLKSLSTPLPRRYQTLEAFKAEIRGAL